MDHSRSAGVRMSRTVTGCPLARSSRSSSVEMLLARIVLASWPAAADHYVAEVHGHRFRHHAIKLASRPLLTIAATSRFVALHFGWASSNCQGIN